MVNQDLHVKLLKEAIISCTTQSPSLLRFYGIFWDTPRSNAPVVDYYMVSELCVGGNLRELLYDNPPTKEGPAADPQAATDPVTAWANAVPPTEPPTTDGAGAADTDTDTDGDGDGAAGAQAAQGPAWAARARLSDRVFRQLLMEILSGVEYLHENNVVHGDLRPEHILLLRPIEQLGAGGSTCIVKIVDHAESQFMSKTTGGNGVRGTPPL